MSYIKLTKVYIISRFILKTIQIYRIDKKPGDSVQEDEVVCEIETDKTAMPVMAPASGVIEEFYVQNGDTVKAGQKIFRLKLGPAGAKAAPKEEAAAAPLPPPPTPAAAAAPQPPTPTPSAPPPPPPPRVCRILYKFRLKLS